MKNNDNRNDYRLFTEIIPIPTRTTLRSLRNELTNNFMIVGGIATVFYGTPRFTRDLDLAVEVETENMKTNLLNIIKYSDRYSLIYPDHSANRDEPELITTEDLEKVNIVRLRDKQTGILIDFLLIGRTPSPFGLELASFKRAKRVKIDESDATYALPSAEDFILMKLVSRRASTGDFQDMFTALLNSYDSLDWSYLFERAQKLKVDGLLKSYRERAAERMKK